MRCKYSVVTTTAVATTAVAKTIIGVRGGNFFGLDLYEWGISFDGITAANAPVLVELCYMTGASSGTFTAITPIQIGGRIIPHGTFNTGQDYTVEPTVLTVVKSILLTPNGGTFVETWDAMNGMDSALAQGFAIRTTAPNTVNCRAYLEYCRV